MLCSLWPSCHTHQMRSPACADNTFGSKPASVTWMVWLRAPPCTTSEHVLICSVSDVVLKWYTPTLVGIAVSIPEPTFQFSMSLSMWKPSSERKEIVEENWRKVVEWCFSCNHLLGRRQQVLVWSWWLPNIFRLRKCQTILQIPCFPKSTTLAPCCACALRLQEGTRTLQKSM